MLPDYMFVAGEMEQKLLCIFFLDTLYHFFLPINPIPYGLFNKRKVMGGGRSAPPSYMAIGEYFQYSFLTGVSHQPENLLKNHQFHRH